MIVPHLLQIVGEPGRPMAPFVTTSGWMEATARVVGDSIALTPSGPRTASELLSRVATDEPVVRSGTRRWRSSVSNMARPLSHRRRVQALRRETAAWYDRQEIAWVWERASGWPGAGEQLSKKAACPLVLSVHAFAYREAAAWAGRGGRLQSVYERMFETRYLRSATIVTCVSDIIASAVAGAGVDPARILVTPNGVDCTMFAPAADTVRPRRPSGISFVWTGSFRPFHGLALLLRAFAQHHQESLDSHLYLVGDGPLRQEFKRLSVELGCAEAVSFLGPVPHSEMPSILRSMDVGVIASESIGDFHYSPVKLREYMASGLAVVVPRVGEMENSLTDGEDAILVDGADQDDLAAKMTGIARDASLRSRIGSGARRWAVENASWDANVQAVVSALARVQR